jgi:hypothetical protein
LARDSIKNDLALSAAARRSSDKTPVSPGVTMSMGPVASNAPEVDDVSDEVNRFGVIVFEKIKEQVGLGRSRSQMHVRNE